MGTLGNENAKCVSQYFKMDLVLPSLDRKLKCQDKEMIGWGEKVKRSPPSDPQDKCT